MENKAADDFIDSLSDIGVIAEAEPVEGSVDEQKTDNKEIVKEEVKEIEKVQEGEPDEKKTEETKEPLSKETEKKEELSEVDSLKVQLEKLEGRRKGSETSFNEANKGKLNAIKEIDALKSQLEKMKTEKEEVLSKADKEFSANFDTQYEADPEGSIRDAVKLLLDRTSKIDKVQSFDMDDIIRKQRIVADEAIMKNQNPDFDVVIDAFLAESQSNSDILSQWNDSGQSVAKAYELGKPVFEAREIMKDPDAYKEKLRKEILAEKKSPDKPPEKTRVSSLNSSGARPKAGDKIHDELSSSDSVLSSIGIKGY